MAVVASTTASRSIRATVLIVNGDGVEAGVAVPAHVISTKLDAVIDRSCPRRVAIPRRVALVARARLRPDRRERVMLALGA